MNIVLISAAIALLVIAVGEFMYRRGYNKGSTDAFNDVLDYMEEHLEITEEQKAIRRQLTGGK